MQGAGRQEQRLAPSIACRPAAPGRLHGGCSADNASYKKPGVRIAVKVGCCGTAEDDSFGMCWGCHCKACAAHSPNGNTNDMHPWFKL